MRRYQRPGLAAVSAAFGLGLLLALTCSLRLALILAAILMVWRSPRWLGGILQRLLRIG